MGTTTERERLGTRLRRRYEAGASIRALARETGRSQGYVRRLLVESGTTLRGAAGTGWRAKRDRMIREGRLLPATRSRRNLPPPLPPLRGPGPTLSEIVIAHRGGG